MSGETCNIFGRCKNKVTRQLTDTPSQLHSDLLDLTKQAESVKDKRDTANKMFLLTQSSTFDEEYFEELYPKAKGQTYGEFVTADPMIEPSLWDLYRVLTELERPFNTSGITFSPDIAVRQIVESINMPTLEEVIRYFNSKLSQYTYENYEDALRGLRDLNQQYSVNNLYMLTIAMNREGKFVLQATENTQESQQKLLDDISAYQSAQLLIEELKNRNLDITIVNSIQESLLKMPPKEAEGTVDNMMAILQVSPDSFNAQLAYKTALFIVKALENGNSGKPHPLITRLKKLARTEYQTYRQKGVMTPFLAQLRDSNPTLWESLQMEGGQDETAVAAYIIAGYLENWESTKMYLEGTTGLERLIDRIIDWVKHFVGSWSVNFANTKIKARVLALQTVKTFLGGTNKLNITNAGTTRLNMQEDTKTLFDALTSGLQDLDFALKELKDINYNAWKVFNNQFKDRMTNLHEISQQIEESMKQGTSSLDDIKAQMEMMQELVSLISFIGENITSCKDSMEQVIRGVDKEGNPLDYNESAKMIKYTERILSLAQNLQDAKFKILAQVDPAISFEAPNGFTYSMKDYIENLKRVFDQLTAITNKIDLEYLGPNQVQGNMQTALRLAREKVATSLLVEINGGEFLAIEQYISAKHGKIVRNAAKMYHMEDLLSSTISGEDSVDCCPPSQWISRFIDAMADSPDIINQLLQDKVAQQKHSANIKTLDMMERLRNLYRNIPTHHGIRNTRRYMEVDDDGKLTGNIITERNFGKWEEDFKKAKRDFEDNYFLNHKEEYKTRDEMLADKLYLVEFGKAMESWHQFHSKKVTPTHAKDGTPITYKDGSKKSMYVPLLESEKLQREEALRAKGTWNADSTISTYDNSQYTSLTDEDKAWLKEYLIIKQELDDLLPQGSTPLGGVRVPQFRGTLTNRIGNIMRQGGQNAMFSVVRYLNLQKQELTGKSPFETEFGGEHDTYDSDLYDSDGNIIFTRAHSNMIQTIPHLPLYGVRKLPDMDQLSTDLCSSLLAYASMAYNHEALDQVVTALEVTKDSLWLYRKGSNGFTLAEQRSVTSQEAGVYGRLEDFMYQQVYSIYSDSSKSAFNRVARKMFSKVARIGSLWYLGWNLHGGVVNALTGMYQIIRRSMKGEGFSFWAMLKAHVIYFMGLERNRGRMEQVKNLFGSPGSDYSETHDALNLFKRRYNISNNNQRDFRDWHIGTFGYRFSFKQKYSDLMHLCYSFFEDYMSTVPYLATALDTELVYKGQDKHGNPIDKKINLWNALCKSREFDKNTNSSHFNFSYDKYYIKDQNATDVLNGVPPSKRNDEWLLEKNRFLDPNSDTFKVDRKNNIVYRKFDEIQDSRFRNKAQMNNNAMHGIYNTQDGGAMMRYAAGGAIASLRKYAIGLVDDRFARARYDLRTRSIKHGDYVALFDVILLSAIFQPIDVWKENTGLNRLAAIGNFLVNIGALATLPVQLCFGTHTKHFTKLGLSKSQIRSLNGVMADQVLCYLMEIALSFWAPPGMEEPPEDEEDLEAFFEDQEAVKKYKEEIREQNYTFKKRLQRAAAGNFHILFYYPFGRNPDGGRSFYIDGEKPQLNLFQDALLSLYTWSEKIMPFEVSPLDNVPSKDYTIDRIYKGGVDHKGYHYDSKGNLKFSKFSNKGTTPFSFKAIAYYTTYRNLVELRAYNPLYLEQTMTEFRSILSSSLPGAQALVDVISLGVQLGTEALNEDAPIYEKGINKGYYKWFKRLEKSALDPLRSMSAVYISGYQAQENFTYFLEKEGDTFLQQWALSVK